MNNPNLCESEGDEQLPKSQERDSVNVLLDISEEQTLREQDAPDSYSKTLCRDTIEGWGLSLPLVCLFQAQKMGRKIKQDLTDSHCLLCAELKQPELPASDSTGTTSAVPEEPLKTTVSSSTELLKRAPSNTPSLSSLEKETSDFTNHKSNIQLNDLENEVPFEGKECVHDKTPPHPLQPITLYPRLKDSSTERVTNANRLIVLPPVNICAPTNPKNATVLKRRGVADLCLVEGESSLCAALGPCVVGEKVGIERDRKKEEIIPYTTSMFDTLQGSLTSKHGPAQYQYQLLSAFNLPMSKRTQVPFSALTDTLPRASSPPWTKPPLRQGSGHRQRLSFKASSLRRAEPELPMLFGTRVPIPASNHRLL